MFLVSPAFLHCNIVYLFVGRCPAGGVDIHPWRLLQTVDELSERRGGLVAERRHSACGDNSQRSQQLLAQRLLQEGVRALRPVPHKL